MKKLLLGIATFAMMAVLCVVSAGAKTYGDFEYALLDDGTVEITDYTGSATELEIPSEIEGKAVASIGERAFAFCDNFTSVIIPDGITNIAEYAFRDCYSLKTVTIPESVTDIGTQAFLSCTSLISLDVDLDNKQFSSKNGVLFSKDMSILIWYPGGKTDTSYIIPDSVTNIGIRAFVNCDYLTKITVSNTVTDIGDYAFYNCSSLETINIPSGVTNIKMYTFGLCTKLTSITIPDNVISISDRAFYNCSSLETINIPNSITSIGNEAFTNTAIINKQSTSIKYVDAWAVDCDANAETVNIKDGTTAIASYTFYQCKSLKSVTIPDSVTNIGVSAFNDCTSLTSIVFPYGITTVKANIFYGCTSLANVILPNSITTIEENAFKYCSSLETIDIPDSVKSIGDNAFNKCTSLVSIVIPDSVTSMGNSVFTNCSSLVSATLHNNIKTINDFTFNFCTSLTSVVIPAGITNIGEYAFCNCTSLKSVIIPDSVTSIGSYAFRTCISLTSVTIPKNVTNIGSYAFAYIDDLVINCFSNSSAHKYAVENNINYILLDAVTVPEDVTGFKLGGRASNALRLNWTANETADGYIIEQYKDGKWVRIAKITNPATITYRVTGLAAGTAYKFRMRAYVTDGSTALYSSYTSTLAARTNPSNVAGLKIGGRASNALRLNWTKNTSADGYIVEQYKSGKWVRIAKITSNATTTYRVTGLKASTQYKFRVRAYKMSGSTALYSGYTSTLSAYTNPSNVTNLKITGKSGTALRLGWSKNTSADGYIVEMYKGGKWVRAVKITSNATVTYRKSGLKKGTTYKFRVRTYNMVGKTALYGGYVNVNGTTNK